MASKKIFDIADELLKHMSPEDLLNEILRTMSDGEAFENLFVIAEARDIDISSELRKIYEEPLYEPEGNPDSETESNPSGTTVSVWLEKERFPTLAIARRWLRGRPFQSQEYYKTDGFYAFPQMSRRKEIKYKGKIRSKYITEGVLLKFVPARFMK